MVSNLVKADFFRRAMPSPAYDFPAFPDDAPRVAVPALGEIEKEIRSAGKQGAGYQKSGNQENGRFLIICCPDTRYLITG